MHTSARGRECTETQQTPGIFVYLVVSICSLFCITVKLSTEIRYLSALFAYTVAQTVSIPILRVSECRLPRRWGAFKGIDNNWNRLRAQVLNHQLIVHTQEVIPSASYCPYPQEQDNLVIFAYISLRLEFEPSNSSGICISLHQSKLLYFSVDILSFGRKLGKE